MPKGVSKARAQELATQKNTLVPPGAKFFPGSDMPIPEGVTIRSGKGVQIEFMFQNVRCTETLRGKPTVDHVLAAADKRVRVLQLIGLGRFDYGLEFPDSSRGLVASGKGEVSRVETLGEAFDEWLAFIKGTVGTNAFKDYTKDINFLKSVPLYAFEALASSEEKRRGGLLHELPVNELTDAGINHFRSWLLAKPVTIKRVLNVLIPLRGTMRRLADTRKKIPHNPFDFVRPLVKDKAGVNVADPCSKRTFDGPLQLEDVAQFIGEDHMPDPFSPEEAEAILGHLSGPFFNQILFWFWTGLRTGELIELKWSDVDLAGKRINIRRSLSRGVLTSPKSGRARWVDLPPPAFKALTAQFEHTGQQREWMFLNPWTGDRWANESKIATRFKKACHLAGVRYRRPYHCRHTYASTLLSAGENQLYVAEQMGHKDWSMISKVYGRWIKKVDGLAGTRVAEMYKATWSALGKMVAARQTIAEDLASEDERGDDEVDQVDCIDLAEAKLEQRGESLPLD